MKKTLWYGFCDNYLQRHERAALTGTSLCSEIIATHVINLKLTLLLLLSFIYFVCLKTRFNLNNLH